ncbi:hypothetical protein DFH08DRAFT_1087120, partial [Mycena albidolilacea]
MQLDRQTHDAAQEPSPPSSRTHSFDDSHPHTLAQQQSFQSDGNGNSSFRSASGGEQRQPAQFFCADESLRELLGPRSSRRRGGMAVLSRLHCRRRGISRQTETPTEDCTDASGLREHGTDAVVAGRSRSPFEGWDPNSSSTHPAHTHLFQRQTASLLSTSPPEAFFPVGPSPFQQPTPIQFPRRLPFLSGPQQTSLKQLPSVHRQRRVPCTALRSAQQVMRSDRDSHSRLIGTRRAFASLRRKCR